MRFEIHATSKCDNLLAFARLDVCILRIKGAFVLTAAQIGHANPGEQSSIELIRRKGARATQYCAGNTGPGKHLPDWNAFTLIHNLRRGKRIFRTFKVAEGSIRKVCRRVAGDEVEDSVPPGICACRKRGPR